MFQQIQPETPVTGHNQNANILFASEDLTIRQIKQEDMASVLRIERNCFEYSWTAYEFYQALGTEACRGFVAEKNKCIVAYLIIELGHGYVTILNLAVDTPFRRTGVASALLEKTIENLLPHTHSVDLTVRERNLPAQLFFRSQGFYATAILRNFYDNMPEDAYILEKKLDKVPFDRIPYYSEDNKTIQITLQPVGNAKSND